MSDDGPTHHRGHKIERVDVNQARCHRLGPQDCKYVYCDNKTPVADDIERDCGHCGLANTSEGHDACIGTLPGVMNACCGHGHGKGWVQFQVGPVAFMEKTMFAFWQRKYEMENEA